MSDLIDRQALIAEYDKVHVGKAGGARKLMVDAPTIEERKKGKWFDRFCSEEKEIKEWQTCKCSVCGRYDTRPYMYHFVEPNFCSWCGADMRGNK